MRFTPALIASAFCAPAFAHDGHGLSGSHWHAPDTLGFIGVVVAVGVALWWSSGEH